MVVLKFIEWMEAAAPQARAEAVEPLVRIYFRPDLPPADRDLVDAALTVLLDDPAQEVRLALARALARHEAAPRHLIIALSQDVPDVAEAVFRRSPCLLDGELVEAVRHVCGRLQVAIAERPWVSFALSAVIAAEGEREAVLALVRNAGADLDEAAFAAMVRRFSSETPVRDALLQRADLPISSRQALIAGLGTTLSDLLVSRSWMTARRAESVVREACDKATVSLAAEAGDAELARLVEHLRGSGQLTTALLIRSVCHGHIRFLEMALARLSGLPASRVYPILAEGRAASLRALFTRAGLPARSHDAFAVALETWRELAFDGEPGDRPRFARRMIERILTRYQAFNRGEVDDLVAMLRRLAAEVAREAARALLDAERQAAALPKLTVDPAADVPAVELTEADQPVPVAA